MVCLKVDLMASFFDPTSPMFGPGLDLSDINILTKFHEDCIKTAPSKVYACFFFSKI